MINQQPPAHLQRETRKWFAAVCHEYALEEHQLRILTLAAEAWDRNCAANETLAKQGLTYTDRLGALRLRPEIGVERDSRISFNRLCRELRLDANVIPHTPR